MTKEKYDEYMKSRPSNTVLVSVENGVLVINAPGDIVFTPEAYEISLMTEPIYVNLIAWSNTN